MKKISYYLLSITLFGLYSFATFLVLVFVCGQLFKTSSIDAMSSISSVAVAAIVCGLLLSWMTLVLLQSRFGDLLGRSYVPTTWKGQIWGFVKHVLAVVLIFSILILLFKVAFFKGKYSADQSIDGPRRNWL